MSYDVKQLGILALIISANPSSYIREGHKKTHLLLTLLKILKSVCGISYSQNK